MSESQARSILEAVAAGDISPSEASELLDAVSEDDRTEQTTPIEPGSERTIAFEGSVGTPMTAAHRAEVVAALHGGPITVSCESDTAVPYADGPASVKIEGDADAGYTVQGDLGDDSAILLPTAIDLRLEANGDDFELTGIDGTLTAQLNVGDIRIEGRFSEGESRIEANAGDIHLRLRPGSDVEVISRAPARIHAEGLEHTGRGRWTLGGGTAKIEIAGNLGSIMITAG